MADEETMTVEVRFWPDDMTLVGTTQTWPEEKARLAISDHRAVKVEPKNDEPDPAPTPDAAPVVDAQTAQNSQGAPTDSGELARPRRKPTDTK